MHDCRKDLFQLEAWRVRFHGSNKQDENAPVDLRERGPSFAKRFQRKDLKKRGFGLSKHKFPAPGGRKLTVHGVPGIIADAFTSRSLSTFVKVANSTNTSHKDSIEKDGAPDPRM